MKWYWKFGIGVGVGAIGTVFFVHYPRSSQDWATWIGAIGTILAFGGTIWIATAQTRRNDIEKIQIAKLHSLALLHELEMITAVVGGMQSILSAMAEGRTIRGTDEQYGMDAVYIMLDEINKIEYKPVSALVPLLPLNNGVAESFSAGMEKLGQTKRFLRLQIKNERHITPEGRRQIGEAHLLKMQAAGLNFDYAFKACRLLAKNVELENIMSKISSRFSTLEESEAS